MEPFDWKQANGTVYERDLVHQIKPMMILEDGSKYEGEHHTHNNLFDGLGVRIWKNGMRYDGKWADGK